jgi:uncharacterized protein (DUF1499 family)
MPFLHWFTRNWADTDDPSSAVAPVDLPVSVGEAQTRVEAAIRSLPRWQIESADPAKGTIDATRRTRLGFVDDIAIRLEAIPGGTRIHARSQARLGKADLGQNRRNLLSLLREVAR